MRRIRCPHCDSLETAEVIIYKRDDAGKAKVTGSMYTCDACDNGWEDAAEHKAIKAARKAAKEYEPTPVAKDA